MVKYNQISAIFLCQGLGNFIEIGRDLKARGRARVLYNYFLSTKMFSPGGKSKAFKDQEVDTIDRTQEAPETYKSHKSKPQGHISSNIGRGEETLSGEQMGREF